MVSTFFFHPHPHRQNVSMNILNIILTSSSFYVHKYTYIHIHRSSERESTDYEKLSIVVWYEGIAIKCNLWMNKKRTRRREIVLRNSLFFYGK